LAQWGRRMHRFCWLPRVLSPLLMLLVVLFTSAARAQVPRLALLIGNSKYADKVGPLKNPRNDVTLVGRALKDLGFSVTIIYDADYRTMDSAIKRYVDDVRGVGNGAISFFYYSGHGVANPETRINYLIPVDLPDPEDKTIWYQSFQQNEIIDRLSQQAPNATHYVVFDACRNELHLSRAASKSIGADKGFVPIQQTAGLLLAYSTAPNRTASDIGDGAGPYATVLAEELVKPGIEAVTMFRNVQIRVKESIGQDPWLSFPSLPSVYLAGRVDLAKVETAREEAARAEAAKAEAAKAVADAERAKAEAARTQALAEIAKSEAAKAETLKAEAAKAQATTAEATAKAEVAKAEAARAQAQAEIAKSETAKTEALKAEAAKAQAANAAAEAAKVEAAARAEAARAETTKAEAAKAVAEAETAKAEAARTQALADIAKSEAAKADAAKAAAQIELAKSEKSERSERAAPAKTIDATEIAQLLQLHLKRVGCDPGAVDGNWTAESRQALESFNKNAGSQFDIAAASLDALDAVRAKASRVCPLVCGSGFRVDGDRCTRIVQAPSIKPVEHQSSRSNQPSAPRAGAKCFSFNGKQFCE
jgi:uncharacterized caspase-like protein